MKAICVNPWLRQWAVWLQTGESVTPRLQNQTTEHRLMTEGPGASHHRHAPVYYRDPISERIDALLATLSKQRLEIVICVYVKKLSAWQAAQRCGISHPHTLENQLKLIESIVEDLVQQIFLREIETGEYAREPERNSYT